MKKLLTLGAIAVIGMGLTVSSNAQAPGPGGPGGRLQAGQGGPGGGRMMMRLGETQKKILGQLDLSADQKKKIEALDKKTKTSMEKLMKEPGDRQAKGPKMREIMQSHREDLNKILTPAQQKKYQELMKAEMQKMRDQRGDRGPAGGRKAPPAKKP